MAAVKPTLREIAIIELNSVVLNGVKKIMEDARQSPLRSCLNCIHWIPERARDKNGVEIPTANDKLFPPETCKLYKQRPPASVIVYACASYEDNDDIPF